MNNTKNFQQQCSSTNKELYWLRKAIMFGTLYGAPIETILKSIKNDTTQPKPPSQDADTLNRGSQNCS